MEEYGEIVPLKRRDHAIVVESMKSKTGCFAVAWNAPKICSGKKCPINDRCVAVKKDEICQLHKSYLNSIFEAAMDMLGIGITTREAVRLGMHIIPLYSILFDLKIAQSRVGNVYTMTRDGSLKINPIYKEIREQIKCIDEMWSKLGYRELVGHGTESDSDYCANMFAEQ